MTDTESEAELEADAAKNGELLTPVEARQAVKTGYMRWVLAISVTLGVVALGGAYAWYEAAQSHTAAPAADQRPANG